jgi:hypothetical protein
MNVGRTIAVALLGFLFMLFVAIDLVVFGVVALNSVVVTVLPVIGLVLGIVLGIMAGKRQTSAEAGDDTGPAALADA